MTDKNSQPSLSNSLAGLGSDTKSPFESAFDAAMDEFMTLKQEEQRIAIRKAQLADTMRALWPIVFPQKVDIAAMKLSDAIRLVFSSVFRPLSAVEVKTKLDDLGFDMKKFNNPLASIHVAMKRMLEADELKLASGDDEKKKFEPGAELKPVAETIPLGSLLEPIKLPK